MDKSEPPPYSPSPSGVGTSSYVPPPPTSGNVPQLTSDNVQPAHGHPANQGYSFSQPPPAAPITTQCYYQPHESRVVITNGPPIFRSFGPDSQLTICQYCHQHIATKVVTEASNKTHLFALVLCLVGLWPCCLLPYFMDSCQSRQHHCSHCNAYLGSYSN